jgi:RNA polymerase sigma-70 factor
MQGTPALAAAFLAHTKVRLDPPPDAAALEHLLKRAWEDARAKWPTVALAPELFVKHVAVRLLAKAAPGPLEMVLESRHLAELYLACACLHGIPSAIKAFEHHYLTNLHKQLGQHRHSAAALDEICQLTRVKILVPTSNGPPKIAEYTGKGSLQGWVRATALRISIRQQEANKPGSNEDSEDILEILPEPGAAPDMDAIRNRHHADLRKAMHEAFALLSADARYLLRLYYVDKLSMYDIAELLKVSQPTISRRLDEAREKVYKETRRLLQQRLGLSQPDFQSLMQLLDSKFDVRISKLLGQAPAEAAPPEKPD